MTLDLTAQGFSLNNARICLAAAADAYRNPLPGPDLSPITLDKLIWDQATDTHVLIRDAGNALIIAFRGSASLKNWWTDFDVHKSSTIIGTVHDGFWVAVQRVLGQIAVAITHADPNRKVIFITGHSLGAALALLLTRLLWDTLCGHDYILHSCYTFGQPRIGDASFAKDCPLEMLNRVYRVTNRADIVPWAPLWPDYRHVGNEIHFDDFGLHQHFPLASELAFNGLEIWREARRGQDALLRDHPVTRYQEALG